MGKKNSIEFLKVRQYVVDRIITGTGQTEVLPSLRKLGEMFGVSHPTALRAVRELIRDRYLRALPGGGYETCPERSYATKMKLYGIVIGNGNSAYEIYYQFLVREALGLELTRRSDLICAQLIYINTSSELRDAVEKHHLSGLILGGVKDRNIAKAAAKLHAEGLPVVSLIDPVPGVSSVWFDEARLCAQVLEKMFQENRRKICVLPGPGGSDEKTIRKYAEPFMKQYGVDSVMFVAGSRPEQLEKLTQLLEFGTRFDGVIAFKAYRGIYELMKSHCDVETQCRMGNIEFSVYDDLRFTGWVFRPDLKSAAKRLIDNLLEQSENPGTEVLDQLVNFQIEGVKNGVHV